MPTIYFLVFTIVGGILALFISAGINSYQYNELPDIQSLFRWFLAGSVTSGLGSYAYIFGANGDPSQIMMAVNGPGRSLRLRNERIPTTKMAAPEARVRPVYPVWERERGEREVLRTVLS